MTGLLINGALHPISGLTIVPPAAHGGPAWATLGPGDYRARQTTWVRQIILHTTKGIWPQSVRAGSGPGGGGKIVGDFWRDDPAHSAAQLVVDTDGSVVCLCDLARVAAYHAEGSNGWSIGIEMYQLGDGGIYEATLIATTLLVMALTWSGGPRALFPIPAQMPSGYHNRPIRRMEAVLGGVRRNLGGPDCVGVFGHRHNTGGRGRGDPGDEIFARLGAVGFESHDYDQSEDRELGMQRQLVLNAADARMGLRFRPLAADGVCGPASLAAMRRHGYRRWRDVGAAEAA